MVIATGGWGTWAEVVAIALYLPAALWLGVIEPNELQAGFAFVRQRFRLLTGGEPRDMKQASPGTD